MANSNSGYVGRFGDTLRRLTALDAQKGAFAPQAIGGADTAGAFSAAPPQAAPQPPAPIQGTQDPVMSPFGAGSAAPQADGAIESSPITFGDLSSTMPKEQKNAIADQIEEKTGDLKGTYQKAAEAEGITPRKRASRGHMAMFLAEIALRAAANRSTSGSYSEALAKGTLQTTARRGAMEADAAERARKESETRRLEGREDTETLRKEGRVDEKDKTTREQKLEDDKRDHEQALELARLQAQLQKRLQEGKGGKITVDDQGNFVLIDEKGDAVTVTREEEEIRGSRGQGTTVKKVRKPVKSAPKTNASGLDKDTIQRMISDRIKQLLGSDRKFKKLPPEEQSRIATEQVMREVNTVEGGRAPAAAPEAKVVDWSTLPK
jgi:hypothetical protein